MNIATFLMMVLTIPLVLILVATIIILKMLIDKDIRKRKERMRIGVSERPSKTIEQRR